MTHHPKLTKEEKRLRDELVYSKIREDVRELFRNTNLELAVRDIKERMRTYQHLLNSEEKMKCAVSSYYYSLLRELAFILDPNTFDDE